MMRQADLNPSWWADAIWFRLATAAFTITASAIVMNRKPRPSAPPRPRRVRVQIVREPRPDLVRASQPPHYNASAFRSLFWETRREMWPVWPLLVAFGLAGPLVYVLVTRTAEPSVFYFGSFVVSLVAGISVFGPSNRRKTHRFLANQGTNPKVVWWTKIGLWLFPPMAIALYLLTRVGFDLYLLNQGNPFSSPVAFLMIWAYTFSVGQLCGMAIKREITAALVAFLLSFLVLLPMIAQLSMMLVIGWGLFAIPAALLVVSRLWCADWMLDRPGSRRWGKLAGLLVAAFAILFVGACDLSRLRGPDA